MRSASLRNAAAPRKHRKARVLPRATIAPRALVHAWKSLRSCTRTSGIFRTALALALLSAHTCAWISLVAAADIYPDMQGSPGHQVSMGITIEGPIERGDFDRFLRTVIELGRNAPEVFIYSKGGDAFEAMKIGSLIRALKLPTATADGSPSHPMCFHGIRSETNCSCESACFLIWAAGIERFGSVVGLHRTYIDHTFLRGMDAESAASASKAVSESVARYLSEMGVPTSYIERSARVPSGEIAFLKESEISEMFSGPIPELAEWITANCGDSRGMLRKVLAEHRSDPQDPLNRRMNESMTCKVRLQRRLFAESFAGAVVTALKTTQSSESRLREYSEEFGRAIPFGFATLLGKPLPVAFRSLKIIGVTSSVNPSELPTTGDGHYVGLRESDGIEFLVKNGKIDAIFLHHDQGTRYEGPVEGGLLASDDRKKVLDTVGVPDEQGAGHPTEIPPVRPWIAYNEKQTQFRFEFLDDGKIALVYIARANKPDTRSSATEPNSR